MSYGEAVCVLCGDAVESHVGGRTHAIERRSDGEPVGRVCDACVEAVLDDLPEGEACVDCDATAAYAHVPLTLKRTAEGEAPYLARDGDPTPVLCAEHFQERAE